MTWKSCARAKGSLCQVPLQWSALLAVPSGVACMELLLPLGPPDPSGTPRRELKQGTPGGRWRAPWGMNLQGSGVDWYPSRGSISVPNLGDSRSEGLRRSGSLIGLQGGSPEPPRRGVREGPGGPAGTVGIPRCGAGDAGGRRGARPRCRGHSARWLACTSIRHFGDQCSSLQAQARQAE